MKIIAAVIHEAGAKFAIENVELQEPKTGEILVKVLASGICHTDVEGVEGHLPTAIPAVLGHEGAGEVVKVGLGVTEFQPGDRVGFSFAYCNACANCYAGRPVA